jgi:DNA (cytosine-5)-methyltransferase 1
MQAISLFSGAGGLDLGCEASGFRTVAAVELDATARDTMLANRSGYFRDLDPDSLFPDITALDIKDLLSRAGLSRGDAALIHGGPPCTPFSKSGYWLEYKRAGADPRASLLDNFIDVVGGVQPATFLMENVFGLAYRGRSRPMLDRFLAMAEAAGYEVDFRVILAADLGVPQLRQRLFCVGLRRDVLGSEAGEWSFPWPAVTHSGPHETRTGWDASLPRHRTAGEALASLTEDQNPPELEEHVHGTYAELLRATPPGENYLHWTSERGHRSPKFKWRSRYWNFLLKLNPDRPSPTIQGQPGPWVGPFHWESRRLRVGELKRLMTFPDDFRVLGTRREQQLQLGNAVPPLLAQKIAAAIAGELRRLRVEARLGLAA